MQPRKTSRTRYMQKGSRRELRRSNTKHYCLFYSYYTELDLQLGDNENGPVYKPPTYHHNTH